MLPQFVSSSPWEVAPVRKTLARLAIGVIDPQAWVIDDTGQAKEVTVSACVARQYSGALGKIGTARSRSACTPSPTPRPHRWTGGCRCPRALDDRSAGGP